uniref:type II secretion system F family protein n=1 Tax=Clostridium sp. NkU-1 TaxID=1095009 RepID=UPI000AE84DDF
MKTKAKKRYSARELSAFCLQISILLHAAIPLDEGLSVMAEDSEWEEEKQILMQMAEEAELGVPFSKVLENTGVFPAYVIHMAKLGEETGTLDQIMESLAGYYEKEHILMKSIRNAVTYPIIMIFMLLVVLLVLFTRVMPIFENVYQQLGAEMSPVSLAATRLGGVFCGVSLALSVLLALAAALVWLLGRKGKKFLVAERLIQWLKRRSRMALAISNRRFTAVLALTLHSGLELEKGMELAGQLVENQAVEEKIRQCGKELEAGTDYYTAMKNTGLFKGFYAQMIKVGTRSGRLDRVMEEISRSYEDEADTAMERMVSRFEPTVVAVLAIAVAGAFICHASSGQCLVCHRIGGILMKKWGQSSSAALGQLISLIGFACAVALFVSVVLVFSKKTDAKGAETLRDAIRRASVQCYAIEGRYPPNVEYLEENYGIQIDRNRYDVFYSGFASNFMPDITVNPHEQ